MRLLITGGSSYLGHTLVPMAAAAHQVCYTYFRRPPGLPGQAHRLDIRQAAAVARLVAAVRPQAIIHAAGSNRAPDMTTVITAGAAHLAAAAAEVGARLLHISTDSIFDGRGRGPHGPPYDEAAPPSPVNEYGRAKAAAEAAVRRHPNHVVVRTSLIYDLDRLDHGTAWMAQALRAGEPVTLFTNQRRNPVWAFTLSRACLELLSHPFTGILNVAGQQEMTRADFGLAMLDWWGITRRDTLRLGPSLGGEWPLDCTLDLRLAGRLLHTPLTGVADVLRQRASQQESGAAPKL